MDTRERILQAAARVYAQHGFRGATTRLIAIEAGVNEVSLFRTFGSKAALFEAMMESHAASLRTGSVRWKQLRSPVWQAGPAGSTSATSESPSQS